MPSRLRTIKLLNERCLTLSAYYFRQSIYYFSLLAKKPPEIEALLQDYAQVVCDGRDNYVLQNSRTGIFNKGASRVH